MRQVLLPMKFKFFYRDLRGKTFTLLDVGCGNRSASETKRWFPDSVYHGIDREMYNNTEEDFRSMDAFHLLNLEKDPLDSVPNDHYDVAVMNHVLEHLQNGLEVLGRVTRKVKRGGRIYIEFPSVRSLSLPSLPGTLNFCDDPTHVRIYGVEEVANLLLLEGFSIVRGGPRRDYRNIALFPAILVYMFLKEGKLTAGPFWDITGFADFVYAIKN